MKNVQKVTLSNGSVEQIAKAIALADIVARSTKEKNPSVPMLQDKAYNDAIAKARAGLVFKAK